MKSFLHHLAAAHAKAIPAILAALVFAGLAFVPALLGQAEKPKVEADGKIKVEKTKEDKDTKSMAKEGHGIEIKSLFADSQGKVLIGTKEGLLILENGHPQPLAGFPGRDVKGMAMDAQGRLLVASKMGLHRLEDARWNALHDAEAEDVVVAADGTLYFAPKKMGLLKSTDGGKTWTPVSIPGLKMEQKTARAH